MTKFFLTISFCLLLQPFVHGQDEKTRVAAYGGVSLPMGDFGSQNINNEKAAFAYFGTYFGAEIGHRIKGSNFGLALDFHMQFNQTDDVSIRNQLEGSQPGQAWRVESGIWNIYGLMIGPYGYFKLDDKWAIDASIVAGVLSVTSPELVLSNWWGLVSRQGKATAVTPSVKVNMGLGFQLSQRWSINCKLSYIGAGPEFVNVPYGIPGTNSTISYSQQIGSLGFGLGGAIHF